MALVVHFTEVVLPQIRRISASGIAQLETDLSYLNNVVKALNAESRDLDLWRDYCGMGDENGKTLVRSGERSGDKVLSRGCGASRVGRTVTGWRYWMYV